ncbi:MAG: tetratricopeptide repeat protein [Cyanobacteria bacterium P01_A01_bin.123]
MGDRYEALIEQIVTATLKGQIRSKAQVYDMLQAGIEPGTGEIFERGLQAYSESIQGQLTSDDDLKQAKAIRKQRALKTIQSEWQRWQQENQTSAVMAGLLNAIATIPPDERLSQLLLALDPNQSEWLNRDQLHQLAQQLQQSPDDGQPSPMPLVELGRGLSQGLQTWQSLQGDLIGWVYGSQRTLGFGNTVESRSPWTYWSKVVNQSPLKQLFADLGQHQTVTAAGIPTLVTVTHWVEMAVVLQRLQLGLVAWFDKQPYDPQAGKRLSIATFLTFSVVWSQLWQRFTQLSQPQLAAGCFQMALQVLYQFAQQTYFPLYGGLFAALSGESLDTLLNYLDQPLRQAANTQSKARILTLLGYSQRAVGQYEQALQFHQHALDIAREAGDRPCEIANLNHLSRTRVRQRDYAAAIDSSQRALILARQSGDRLGEANALANLGYSEVFQAKATTLDPERYVNMLDSLQRGLALCDELGDRPSQALCSHSLGVAQVMLGQYDVAIESLQKGLMVAQAIGDRFLQGLNCAYLAEAYRGQSNFELAIYTGSLAMYTLHQINSSQWRQPAGLLSILYGQLGPEAFQAHLASHRPQLLPQIGVDGYDYLLELLTDYRQSI